MRASIRLFGTFRTFAGTGRLEIDLPDPVTVREALKFVVKEVHNEEFGRILIDPETGDPRVNAMVLVSGKDIGALRGLDTVLNDGDELTLLPLVHGG